MLKSSKLPLLSFVELRIWAAAAEVAETEWAAVQWDTAVWAVETAEIPLMEGVAEVVAAVAEVN